VNLEKTYVVVSATAGSATMASIPVGPANAVEIRRRI
jgi:hypothetical protein